MAKVLEALERARLEREKKLAQTGIPHLAASAPAANAPDPEAQPTGDESVNETEAAPAAEPPAGLGATRFTQPARPRHTLNPISEQVIGAHDLQSPITEQLRQIRTNLETVLAEYRSRAIVITSPVSGDGKTLVTANLAAVLADNPEHQVLLIDADLRKPDQHHLFGCKGTPGLADYLRENCTLEQAIHPTGIPNLKIIPGGHPPTKPTVLLSSDRMIALIGELQRHFQWIIFDTPPLLPVTDACVLARECVGLVLVMRMGQTHRKTIERSQDLLAEMRLPVLGCILNDFTSATRDNQYYYKYYHRDEAGGFKA